MDSVLRLITAPEVEPVTVDEVKLSTRISHTAEDAVLTLWIKTARELAEDYQRRAYVTQTREISFDEFPTTPFYIPRAPLISITKISYFDTANVETVLYNSTVPVGTEGDFLIDTSSEPGRVELAYGKVWPGVTLRYINAVKVRYTCGYGPDASTTPETVKDAIKLYCAYRFENRTAESGDVPQQFYNLLAPRRLHN